MNQKGDSEKRKGLFTQVFPELSKAADFETAIYCYPVKARVRA